MLPALLHSWYVESQHLLTDTGTTPTFRSRSAPVSLEARRPLFTVISYYFVQTDIRDI